MRRLRKKIQTIYRSFPVVSVLIVETIFSGWAGAGIAGGGGGGGTKRKKYWKNYRQEQEHSALKRPSKAEKELDDVEKKIGDILLLEELQSWSLHLFASYRRILSSQSKFFVAQQRLCIATQGLAQ
jgi:hypothetical protein